MVIQIEQNPASLKKEILILQELGLSQEEIYYIQHLKEKQEIAERWN